MPNRSSKAGNIPQRTCVICRKKTDQVELLHFKLRDSKVVLDFQRKISGRGYYICDDNQCFERISKWIKRQRKK